MKGYWSGDAKMPSGTYATRSTWHRYDWHTDETYALEVLLVEIMQRFPPGWTAMYGFSDPEAHVATYCKGCTADALNLAIWALELQWERMSIEERNTLRAEFLRCGPPQFMREMLRDHLK
jgi:hypothetical protein